MIGTLSVNVSETVDVAEGNNPINAAVIANMVTAILDKITMGQILPKWGNLLLEIPDSLLLQVTEKQFEALATVNRDLRLERTAKGELIVNPPTGWQSGERNLSLSGQLYYWHEEHEDLGKAFDSSTAFTLPNGAIRSPDTSWVSRERWEALTPEQKRTFANTCPDFVVELRSESDSLSKLQNKMQEYMDNGARLGWLIDPKNQRVEIYRPRKEVEILENPTELSGEDLLPSFVLNLKRVLY